MRNVAIALTCLLLIYLGGCTIEPRNIGGTIVGSSPTEDGTAIEEVALPCGTACSSTPLQNGLDCSNGGPSRFCCLPAAYISGGVCIPYTVTTYCPLPCTNLHIAIPDNSTQGVRVPLDIQDILKFERLTVDINITHPFRGDLVIEVVGPDGRTAMLSDRQGGSMDNFVVTDQDISAAFVQAGSVGRWQLFVRDLARTDVGTINSFALHFGSRN